MARRKTHKEQFMELLRENAKLRSVIDGQQQAAWERAIQHAAQLIERAIDNTEEAP